MVVEELRSRAVFVATTPEPFPPSPDIFQRLAGCLTNRWAYLCTIHRFVWSGRSAERTKGSQKVCEAEFANHLAHLLMCSGMIWQRFRNESKYFAALACPYLKRCNCNCNGKICNVELSGLNIIDVGRRPMPNREADLHNARWYFASC